MYKFFSSISFIIHALNNKYVCTEPGQQYMIYFQSQQTITTIFSLSYVDHQILKLLHHEYTYQSPISKYLKHDLNLKVQSKFLIPFRKFTQDSSSTPKARVHLYCEAENVGPLNVVSYIALWVNSDKEKYKGKIGTTIFKYYLQENMCNKNLGVNFMKQISGSLPSIS